MLLIEMLSEGDVVDLAQRRSSKNKREGILIPDQEKWLNDYVTGAIFRAGGSREDATRVSQIFVEWIQLQIKVAVGHSPYAATKNEFIKITKGTTQPGFRLHEMVKNLIFFVTHHDMMTVKSFFQTDETGLALMVFRAKGKLERKSKLKIVRPNAMVNLDGIEALTGDNNTLRNIGREGGLAQYE